jgi:hypothetical protein
VSRESIIAEIRQDIKRMEKAIELLDGGKMGQDCINRQGRWQTSQKGTPQDVGCWSEENCSRAESEMGKDWGSKEVM